MTYGLEISKDGFNAVTADDENLAFSSRFPMWKEFLSGTGELSIDSTGGADSDEVEIFHNLGYKPAFMIFASNDWASPVGAVRRQPSNNAASLIYVHGVAKDNSLVIKLYDLLATASVTFTYKYFIMIDVAE